MPTKSHANANTKNELSVFLLLWPWKLSQGHQKSDQFFVMSQLYIHKNLVRIQPLLHKILCKQESLTPMPTPTKSYANTNANIENEFSIFLLIWPWKLGQDHQKSDQLFVMFKYYIHDN